MAKALPLKIISAPPVAADMSQAHDISGYMNTPAAPPQMSADFIRPINVPQPKAWRPNALAVLDGVLGGSTITESLRNEEARHEAELMKPQMEALRQRQIAAAGGLDGRELLAYMTNPGKYGENLASRFGAANVSGGDSRVFGQPDEGGSVYTAPKYQVEDHTAVEMGPTGLKVLGQLPRKPEFQTIGKDQSLVQLPGAGADLTAGLPKTAQATADAVWAAAIQQESGGRPGVIGPDTAYGNAQGLTQMLPATAQAMAQKLGVSWRPELMTATSPEGAAYQEQLGRAYFDEGLQKYGGDPAKALAYYHGGPNEQLWGPKTLAHVTAVLSKAGMGSNALAGGSGADTVMPGGARVIATGPVSQPTPPSGYRWNGETLEYVPGGPADPAVKTTAGLKPVPAKIQQAMIENNATIQQIDDTISAIQRNPKALGLWNIAGDTTTQRADPGGVDVRARVANVGSQLIHDRSGAAVTASETPRLKPFVPSAIDTPEAAITKLRALRQQAVNATTGIELAYGEDSGYRPLGSPAATQPTQGGARPAGWSAALPAPQLAAAKRFKGATAPAGDPSNPFLPRSAAEFKNIPPGKSYIDDDGSIQVKR